MKNPDKPFGVVVWEDAWMRSTGEGGLTEDEMSGKTMLCQLYGWIVKSDENSVVVAAEWTPEDNTWRLVATIPRKMVVEERLLSLTKKRAVSSVRIP